MTTPTRDQMADAMDRTIDALHERIDGRKAMEQAPAVPPIERQAVEYICRIAAGLPADQSQLAARVLDIALREQRRLLGLPAAEIEPRARR